MSHPHRFTMTQQFKCAAFSLLRWSFLIKLITENVHTAYRHQQHHLNQEHDFIKIMLLVGGATAPPTNPPLCSPPRTAPYPQT